MGKGMDGTSTSLSNAAATATMTTTAPATTTATFVTAVNPRTGGQTGHLVMGPPKTANAQQRASAGLTTSLPTPVTPSAKPRTSPVIPFLAAVTSRPHSMSAPPAPAPPAPTPPRTGTPGGTRTSAQPGSRPTSMAVTSGAASPAPGSSRNSPTPGKQPSGTVLAQSNSGGHIGGANLQRESFGTRIRRFTVKKNDPKKNAPVRGCICYLNDRDRVRVLSFFFALPFFVLMLTF